jgi:hypothetical protein
MPIVRGYAILAVVPAIVVLSTIGILMAQKRAGIRNAENATTETSPT